MAITGRGLRCDWRFEGEPKPVATLLHVVGSAAVVIDHGAGTLRELPRLDLLGDWDAATGGGERYAADSEFGDVTVWVLPLGVVGDRRPLRLVVALLADPSVRSPLLDTWWRVVVPRARATLTDRGLPAWVEVVSAGSPSPIVSMRLAGLERRDFGLDTFQPPKEHRWVGPQQEEGRWPIKDRTVVGADLKGTRGRPTRHQAAAGPVLHSTDAEDLKLIIGDSPVERVLNAVNSTWRCLDRFEGERFVIFTTSWLRQILCRSPIPADDQTPSVLHGLLPRLGLLLLAHALDELDTQATGGDIDAAVAALPFGDQKACWERFLASLTQPSLRQALDDLLAADLTHCQDTENPLECLAPLWHDFVAFRWADSRICDFTFRDLRDELPSGRQQPVRDEILLGRLWLTVQVPHLDFGRLGLPTRREDPEADVTISAGREISIQSVGDLMDVELSEFEHALSLGEQPLLDPLVAVDPTQLDTLTARFPGLEARSRAVTMALATTLRLGAMETGCDVVVTPADTAATVVLGLFCPPCVLALFQSGFVDASVTAIRIPLLVLAEEDPLGLEPPRLRALVGRIEHTDADFTSVVFGVFPLLSLLLSAIGSVVGDVVLAKALEALSGLVQRGADGVLVKLPQVTPDLVFRAGHGFFREAHRRGWDTARRAAEAQDATDAQRQAADAARAAYEAALRMPTVVGFRYAARTAGSHYQLESSASLSSPWRHGAPLTFPAAGLINKPLAVAMSGEYFRATAADLTRLDSVGPVVTARNGSLVEVDWWQDAPDRTGMPPRPPNAQRATLPPLIPQPATTPQSFWGYWSLISVWPGRVVLRDLDDAPADQPAADLVNEIWIDVGAAHHVPVTYEVCDDITRAAGAILGAEEPPRGPLGPPGPRPGPGPDPWTGHHSARRGPIPARLVVEGGFRPLPGPDGKLLRGPLDQARYAYVLDPASLVPGPDDPGPASQPGVLLCRRITTWNSDERERWLRAQMLVSLPLYLGFIEVFDPDRNPHIKFMPTLDYRVDIESPTHVTSATIEATGPLATLSLPDNQRWLEQLMVEELRRMYRGYRYADRSELSYAFGTNNNLIVQSLELQPEQLLPPTANLTLERLTTFRSPEGSRNLALLFGLTDNMLHRI